MILNMEIIVTISIFILVHIIASVWWASHVNTLLNIVLKNQMEYIADIKNMKETFATKENFMRELALADREYKAIWTNLKEIRVHCKLAHQHE